MSRVSVGLGWAFQALAPPRPQQPNLNPWASRPDLGLALGRASNFALL